MRGVLLGMAVIGWTAGPAAAQFLPVHDAVPGGRSVHARYDDGASPYTGIGRYEGRTNCTAFFLATALAGQEYLNEAPAYAITSARCAVLPGPNEIVLDREGYGHIHFNNFVDSERSRVVMPVARVAYATMKGRDLAVLELPVLYRDLVRRLIRPWRIGPRSPTGSGDLLAVVGTPQSNNPADEFLRLSTCRSEGIVPLVVEHVWHWFDPQINHCRDTLPGTSGSPVLSVIDRYVVGMISTTTGGGGNTSTECALGHPCEPSKGGARTRSSTNYATSLTGIIRCFDFRHRFNAREPGCPLDPGTGLEATPASIGAVNPRLTTQPIGPVRQTWHITVASRQPFYRYAIAAPPQADCRTGASSGPFKVSEAPIIDAPLPEAEGFAFLCIWESPNGDGGAADDRTNAAVVVARIDRTPPRLSAQVAIEDIGAAWRLMFDTVGEEVAFHLFKRGHPLDTRCDDGDGYRLADARFVELPKERGPYRVCAIPYDAAQNRGRLLDRVLESGSNNP